VRRVYVVSGHFWWADCENFQSKSNPDPQKLNPIQSWSAKFLKIIDPIQSWFTHAKPFILFCLMRQNKQSILESLNLTRQCLICHQKQKHSWSYYAIRWTRLVELLMWQGWYTWISAWSLSHDLIQNSKPKLKIYTQNLNPKRKPKT